MRANYLRLFNRKLAAQIAAMSDDELWNFLTDNLNRIQQMLDDSINKQKHFASGFFYAYQCGGFEWFKKHYLDHIEDYRDGVIYTVTLDFCFGEEKIALDYYAKAGFFDDAGSCDVETSDKVMPPLDEDSEEGYLKQYFYLLESSHLEKIIQAMEKHFDKLTVNTREDIAKITEIKNQCVSSEGFRGVYFYNF